MAMLKGLKHFWVAKQIQDNINGVKFETPKLITGLNKVGVKRKSNKESRIATTDLSTLEFIPRTKQKKNKNYEHTKNRNFSFSICRPCKLLFRQK